MTAKNQEKGSVRTPGSIDRVIDRLVGNDWTARLFGLGLGLGLWIVLASAFPNELMPFPYETLALAWGLVESGVAVEHVRWTLWLTLCGFVGAFLVGGIIGVLMGINDYGRQYFTPYIIVGLSIPAIAWAAMTTIIFGFGSLAPITAAVLTTFPFVAINVWKGVEALDVDLVEMGQAFNISNTRLLTSVILPSAAPSLFTAIRFGLAISWKIVTIAEVFAGSQGIGYMMYQSYQNFRFEEAWAWAVLFMIVILLIEYGVLKPLERRVYEYRKDADFDLIV